MSIGWFNFFDSEKEKLTVAIFANGDIVVLFKIPLYDIGQVLFAHSTTRDGTGIDVTLTNDEHHDLLSRGQGNPIGVLLFTLLKGAAPDHTVDFDRVEYSYDEKRRFRTFAKKS